MSLTGISDPLVAPMADSVATLGRQFRRPKEGVPRTKEEDVVSALMKELQQLLENDPNNPLLDLPGMGCGGLSLTFCSPASPTRC